MPTLRTPSSLSGNRLDIPSCGIELIVPKGQTKIWTGENMESSNSNDSKQKQYFRLTITYSDGETSGRVFSSHEKAEKYGARQRRSPVVKKTKVAVFTRERYGWTSRE